MREAGSRRRDAGNREAEKVSGAKAKLHTHKSRQQSSNKNASDQQPAERPFITDSTFTADLFSSVLPVAGRLCAVSWLQQPQQPSSSASSLPRRQLS
mmetsp:Transcript_15438/g.31206  ORF Transcript_15438/g.31206 Transcript_15438/m.31206 type:complete len:97 (+) Transcript_15438:127-417(+)